MKKYLFLVIVSFLAVFNFSCDIKNTKNNFPFRGDWRIEKTEGENTALIAGTLFTFSEEGTMTVKKGIISNEGIFKSLNPGKVVFIYQDTIEFTYNFEEIDSESFKLKKENSKEIFYFKKE